MARIAIKPDLASAYGYLTLGSELNRIPFQLKTLFYNPQLNLIMENGMSKSLSFVVGAGLVCVSGSILASDNSQHKLHNFYLGGVLGSVQADLEGARRFQSDGRISGVYLGYNFSNWFGLEFEYNRTNVMGEYLDVSTTPNSSAWISSVEYESFGLYPTFSWEVGERTELFGKIGYSKITYQETTKTQSLLLGRTFERAWSDYGFGYAIGLKYLFQSNVECRLSFSSMSGNFDLNLNAGNAEAEVKLDSVNFGVGYHFN